MRFSRIRFIALLGCVSIGLTACAATANGKEPAGSVSSLVVAEDVPPQTFDPIASSQIKTMYAWQLAYEGLVRTDTSGKIGPLLATKWTVSPDQKTYDFTLRPGAKFSDGSALTADDVVFSFQRLLEKGLPYTKARFESLKAVSKVDDTTVRFQLGSPNAGFLMNLGSPYLIGSAILSKKWSQSHDPKAEMMGTGPFKFVSYVPNQQMNLVRNDYYWDKAGAAKVAKLTVRYMPEQSAQVAALRSGQIDLMFPSAETNLQLEKDQSVHTVPITSTSTIRLNINTNRKPLNNVDVRRAISLALDRDAIVKGAFLGQAVVSAQVPPMYPWAPPVSDLTYQKHDVAKAKQLLAAAGYPNGITLTLNHLAGYASYLDRFSELVKSQLADAGIQINIQANQNAVWLDKQNKADYELMDNEYTFNADPLFYLMPRPGRQGPTPPQMTTLINGAVASSGTQYLEKLAQVAQIEDDLIFPDLTIAARKAWVSYGTKVTAAQPDSTLSRGFLTSVTVK